MGSREETNQKIKSRKWKEMKTEMKNQEHKTKCFTANINKTDKW